MPSEIEYKFIGDYIEELSKTENPSLADKTLVCNETDGPRYTPANPEALTNVATEADMTAEAKLRVMTPAGEKQLPANLVAKASEVENISSNKLYGFQRDQAMSLNGGVGSTVSQYATGYPGYSYIEIPCLEGDRFVVFGIGGNRYRLWAFIDGDRKIVSVAENSTDASNGVILKASVDGSLCVNCNSVTGEVYKVMSKAKDSVEKKFVSDYAEIAKVSIANVTDGGYISDNENNGTAISYTPTSNSNFVHQVISVTRGERFFVHGTCGTAARLWCFVDASDKVVYRYKGNETDGVNEIEIDSPCDGKLVLNFDKRHPYDIRKPDPSLYADKIDVGFDTLSVHGVSINSLSRVTLRNWAVNAAYATNGSVGDTVTMTPSLVSDMNSIVVPVEKGDKFIVFGSASATNRLWCFVDSSDKIVSQSAASISANNGVTVEAPADGKLVVNSYSSNQNKKLVKLASSNVYGTNESVRLGVESLSMVQKKNWVLGSYITSKVNYGDTVNLTPNSNTSFKHMVLDCNAGDVFKVKSTGGTNPAAWAFVDSNNVLVSRCYYNAETSLKTVIAPADGKFIVNDNYSGSGEVYACDPSAQAAIIANVENRVAELENALPPMTVFETSYDLPDVSSVLASAFDFSTQEIRKTMLEQVYAAFDSLVLAFPDYVSRVDAAEEASIAYPEYANGYDGVPAYKMYMYKFVCSSVGAGNENGRNPKKKLFIIAGQHGDEIAAPVNAYFFAKSLCDAADANFFKLRTSYDVYIIPCVNGFGMHKLTRVNGNGVDLNRNYPISGWSIKGQPGDTEYSGPSAGSEFETQVVVATYNSLLPDIALDHHNYSYSAGSQFYMNGPRGYDYLYKLSYQSLEDCSFTFIKDLPGYFGSSYGLFKSSGTGTLPAGLGGSGQGAVGWFGERHTPCPLLIEISMSINYLNGSPSAQGEDHYGSDTFAVAQYTLTDMLFKVCGYLMK